MKTVEDLVAVLDGIEGCLRPDEQPPEDPTWEDIPDLWNDWKDQVLDVFDGSEESEFSPDGVARTSERSPRDEDWEVFCDSVPARDVDLDDVEKREVIDALAWYVSFRYHKSDRGWGIFIPWESVQYLGSTYFSKFSVAEQLGLAYDVLHRHELFHFFVDYAVAQAELLADEAHYWPSKKNLHNKKGYIEKEEELANGYMLRVCKNLDGRGIKGATDSRRAFVERGPSGYKEGVKWTKQGAAFEQKCGELLTDYLTQRDDPVYTEDHLKPLNGEWLFPRSPFVSRGTSEEEEKQVSPPVHILVRKETATLTAENFLTTIEDIHETSGFQKQMKKLGSHEIHKHWSAAKKKLAKGMLPLSRWKKEEQRRGAECYYVPKFFQGIRPHISKHEDEPVWQAYSIASHKKQGHG